MTDLVLTRHGETTWHTENRYAGSSDVPLTSRGLQQAEHLGEWAREASFAAMWCSPLTRTRDTAAATAHATGLSPRPDDRLRELDFGEAEGLTTAEMEQAFPDKLAAFRADPAGHHLPGGEDPYHAAQRGHRCLTEIADAFPDARVLVVAHGTLLRLVLCDLLGIPHSEYRRTFPFIRNTGITEIRLLDGQCSLLQFNAPVESGRSSAYSLVTTPPG